MLITCGEGEEGMKDLFTKVILTGILICLIVIATKSQEYQFNSPAPEVWVENSNRFVQIAPNIIGIVDTGHNSGKEHLVIFEYDEDANTFNILTALDYNKIFTHPEVHGLR